MKALVTGATGFIGTYLAQHLISSGRYETIYKTDIVTNGQDDIIVADLTSIDGVNSLPDDVDVLFHLAAYNGTKHFYTYPMSVLYNTTLPLMQVIQRYKSNLKKIVYASSSEVYSGNETIEFPTPEVNRVSINDLTNPRWSYASGKMSGEVAVHSAHKEYGIDYVIVRYHNVYGKGQQLHFIPEFSERLANGDGELYGYDHTRSFTYVDDAVYLTDKLDELSVNETFNIGNPRETSVLEVAQLIKEIQNIDTEIQPADAWDGCATRRIPDVSKMLGVVGDYEFIDIKSGLQKTLL